MAQKGIRPFLVGNTNTNEHVRVCLLICVFVSSVGHYRNLTITCPAPNIIIPTSGSHDTHHCNRKQGGRGASDCVSKYDVPTTFRPRLPHRRRRNVSKKIKEKKTICLVVESKENCIKLSMMHATITRCRQDTLRPETFEGSSAGCAQRSDPR